MKCEKCGYSDNGTGDWAHVCGPVKVKESGMNERIREFDIQSGLPTALDYHQKRYEKFAELIVRECMACSIWVGKMNTNSVEPIHTAHAINQRIKEHFGVE